MSGIYPTPDEHFTNLPDFPYQPNYVNDLAGYENTRMHSGHGNNGQQTIRTWILVMR